MEYFTLLTQKGSQKIAAATAANTTVALAEIALGDGNGTVPMPDASKTALVNEVYRAPLNDLRVDENNANWLVAEGYVPSDEGNFWVREVGIFDSEGDLIIIGNYPETFKPITSNGVAKDLYMKVITEVSSADAVSLSVNPSVVMASQEFVNNEMAKKAEKNHIHKWIEIEEKPTTFPPSKHDHSENLTSFNGDLNAFNKTGMFYSVSASNTPTGVDGVFISMIYNIHTATQIFHVYNGDSYYRRRISQVWQPWVKFATENDFLNLKDASGYQKLPNGMILQWGRFQSTTISDQIVDFPITFPNRVCFIGNGGTLNQDLVENPSNWSAKLYTNSQFKANRADSISINHTYTWFAIGY